MIEDKEKKIKIYLSMFKISFEKSPVLSDIQKKQLEQFRIHLSDFVEPKHLPYVYKNFDTLISQNPDNPNLIADGLTSIVDFILGETDSISFSIQPSNTQQPHHTPDVPPAPEEQNESPVSIQPNNCSNNCPIQSEQITSLFNTTHSRKDGSTIKITPNRTISIPVSGINAYSIIQTFPFIKNFSVNSIIFSMLDEKKFVNGQQGSIDYIINSVLSPQKIYKAITEHAGFVYNEPTQESPNLKRVIFEIEKQCHLAWVKDLNFLDDELRYLLPVSIFRTADGTVGQHECSLNLDTSLRSQYIFTNIDYEKLYKNGPYKDFILNLIYEANRQNPERSHMLDLGIIQPSCYNGILGTSDYTRINSPTTHEAIKQYIAYVTTPTKTAPDSPPPPSDGGR